MKKTTKTEVPVQPAKPTSRTVEKLLQELSGDRYDYRRRGSAYELREQYDGMIEAFKKSPAMVKLRKQIDKQEVRELTYYDDLDKRVKKVRQLYYVEGTSPRVLRELSNLVEYVHNRSNGEPK